MPTPLTPQTLVYGFTSAGDPQISPDGQHIAYALSSTDRETKQSSAQIWLCDVDGGNARSLTSTGKRNTSPRWSPDGARLAFVSDRVDRNGIFVLPMAGGEAREVMRYHAPISSLAWSPDGARVAFTADFDPENPTGEKPKEGAAPRVRVTDRIDYKQDNRGYRGDMRSQVFVADVATRTLTMVTKQAFDHGEPAWSPDGRQLLCRLSLLNGMNGRLAIVPVDGGGEARMITPESGTVSTWAWSPTGDHILYTGDTTQTWQPDFFLYTVATGETKRLTTDLQCLPDGGFATVQPPSQPVFLDERRVLFHAFRGGASGLYVIDVETGSVEKVEGELEVRAGFSCDSAGKRITQGLVGMDAVGEIAVIDLSSRQRTVITNYSKPVFDASPAADWERFDITRAGFTTEAWLLKPPGFDASKKYPMVLDIHGGPNGNYGYAFNNIQQLLATNGFVVVYSNPRGSSSYGREFTQQVAKDWGGEDYEDLMAVVDKALERPYIDPARVGIYGYSYGGYMTAWTIGRNHRFKAAVCGAPCFDLESMWGTSDISHTFGELQWGGAPHQQREWYATHSPSTFAHNTRTPTLIIQGEADDRCPVGQGEQMFVALKKAGCEVQFARYPGASHLFMRVGPPEHREDALTRILGWFQAKL